jgi:hypothetical protein
MEVELWSGPASTSESLLARNTLRKGQLRFTAAQPSVDGKFTGQFHFYSGKSEVSGSFDLVIKDRTRSFLGRAAPAPGSSPAPPLASPSEPFHVVDR